jgi:hypothetical protein
VSELAPLIKKVKTNNETIQTIKSCLLPSLVVAIAGETTRSKSRSTIVALNINTRGKRKTTILKTKNPILIGVL